MARQTHTRLTGEEGESPLDCASIARTVVEVTDTLVVVLDSSARIEYFSPACETLTGYSATQVEGEVVFDVLVPEEERADVEAYWRRLVDGTASSQHRNHWTGKSGEERYITWSNAVVEAEDGTPYAVATGLDITEREQLERDIVRVSETERRRIGRELHDTLSTDLVAAAMKLDRLRHRVEGGTVDEDDLLLRLADIEKAVRKGGKRARSISHLLAAGKLPPNKLPEALSKLVRTHGNFTEVDCTLQAPDTPAVQGLDDADTAGHLYRIAQEAVRNAVTHADADHVTVALDTVFNPQIERERQTAAHSALTDECVILRVRDDGRGIPEGETQNRFETGNSKVSDSGRRGEKTGGGIGLQLMRYRADLIGADLSIEPDEDGGTVVQCVLPVTGVTQGS